MALKENGTELDEKSFKLGYDAALGVTKAMLKDAITQGRTLQDCLDVVNAVTEIIEVIDAAEKEQK